MRCLSHTIHAHIYRMRDVWLADLQDEFPNYHPPHTWVGIADALHDVPGRLSGLRIALSFIGKWMQPAENEVNPFKVLDSYKLNYTSLRCFTILKRCCQILDALEAQVLPPEMDDDSGIEFPDDDSGILTLDDCLTLEDLDEGIL